MISDHFLGRFGVVLGSLWDHFGIVLASFWGRFELFWGILGRFLDHFYGHIATFFWWCFGKMTATLKQNDARKGKLHKFPLKFIKMMQLCQIQFIKICPFSPIKHVFCLTKMVKIDVSAYVCSKWVSLEVFRVDFERFLCTFMKVHMTSECFFIF